MVIVSREWETYRLEKLVKKCDICGKDASGRSPCRVCYKDLCRDHQIEVNSISTIQNGNQKELFSGVYCKECLLKLIQETL